jgi:excisionase family DNA binding protein
MIEGARRPPTFAELAHIWHTSSSFPVIQDKLTSTVYKRCRRLFDKIPKTAFKCRINTSPTRTMNTPTRTNQTSAPASIHLLTMQEVADCLDVSLQRAYEMGCCGLLPAVRMGRQIRVEEAGLMSWIESGGRALPGGWKRYPS